MIVLSKNKTIYCFHVIVFTRVICLGSEKDYCVKNFLLCVHAPSSLFIFPFYPLPLDAVKPIPWALEGAQNKGGVIKGLLATAHCFVYRISLPPWSPVLISGSGQAGADSSEKTDLHPNLSGTMAVESTKEGRWHLQKPLGTKTMDIKMLTFENQ